MSLSFVAVDFETANRHRASACAIGAAKVVDGVVVDTFYSLIRPPEGLDEFSPFNIRVHGLTSRDVAHADQFHEVWPQFDSFTEGLPLIAHNTSFDMSVMSQLLDMMGIRAADRDYLCTLILARSCLDLTTYSLPFLASELGLELSEHHNAQADAIAAAQVALELGKRLGAEDFDDLASKAGVATGRLIDGIASGTHRMRRGGARDFTHAQKQLIRSELDLSGVDQTNPCWGKNFAFTGTLLSMDRHTASQLVIRLGGEAQSSVSKTTDFLVFGQQDPRALRPGFEASRKMEKALSFRAKGLKIEVIDENHFLTMCEEYLDWD